MLTVHEFNHSTLIAKVQEYYNAIEQPYCCGVNLQRLQYRDELLQEQLLEAMFVVDMKINDERQTVKKEYLAELLYYMVEIMYVVYGTFLEISTKEEVNEEGDLLSTSQVGNRLEKEYILVDEVKIRKLDSELESLRLLIFCTANKPDYETDYIHKCFIVRKIFDVLYDTFSCEKDTYDYIFSFNEIYSAFLLVHEQKMANVARNKTYVTEQEQDIIVQLASILAYY